MSLPRGGGGGGGVHGIHKQDCPEWNEQQAFISETNYHGFWIEQKNLLFLTEVT